MAAMMQARGATPTPVPMAKGGAVDGDVEAKKPRRKFGAKEEAAEDLPEAPAKKAKGGAIKHRKPKAKKLVVPVPMTPGGDEDEGAPPNLAAIAGAGPSAAPAPAPAGPPPPGMKKGGKTKGKGKKAKKVERKAKGGATCDKMAAGGAMKVRRGFPNVNAAPKKKFAQGGKVRGAGAATKGTRFAGIF